MKLVLPHYTYHGAYYYFNLHSAKLFAEDKHRIILQSNPMSPTAERCSKEPSMVLPTAISPIYTGQLFTTPIGNPITSIQMVKYTKSIAEHFFM